MMLTRLARSDFRTSAQLAKQMRMLDARQQRERYPKQGNSTLQVVVTTKHAGLTFGWSGRHAYLPNQSVRHNPLV
ncbi:MAG: hypothetical protein RID07_16875 [Lacipirellulaceae bacterium]